jgi:hypothetical protein
VCNVATDQTTDQGTRGEENGVDGLNMVSLTGFSFNCMIHLP